INPRSPMICHLNGVPTSCGPPLYAAEPGVFLHNVDGKHFEDRTRASGLKDEGRAMAVCAADLNGDGRLDLCIANDTPANAFVVFSTDADLGIVQADGHVHNHIAEVDPRLYYEQPRQLFENLGGGRFADRTPSAGPALQAASVGRGAAFGDLDNDGDVDVVVN